MIKTIGVLTSGGDSPGMNSAIRAVVRTCLSKDIKVFGIRDGYKGLLDNDIFEMSRKDVSEQLNRGGTLLGSARLPEFKELSVQKKAVEILNKRNIDALVCIGGDGTFRGAKSLSELGIKCIGIPGTIDNDINSSYYSVGFDTASNTIIDAIDKLRDTSRSHHRCTIIEVMGRQCGDLALFAGIACGAEMIITQDTGYNFKEVVDCIELARKRNKKHALIVITENITDVFKLAKDLESKTNYETRATVLGHIQRGGNPSAYDRFMASWMGHYAVELILEGHSARCIGYNNGTLNHYDIIEAQDFVKKNRSDFYKIQNDLK